MNRISSPVIRWIRNAPRFLFFATLIYAPWAYGCTTATSILILDWLLLTVMLLWAAELLIARRKPKLPITLLVITLGLLAIGGWMVLNASSIYDSELGVFVPLRNLTSRAPGSVDYIISAAWMVRGALLLGVILFVADHSRDNRFILQVWWVIAIAAGSFALLGLLQKATGAEMIFWQPRPPRAVSTFFSTFYYHANAGAFLNLVLPLTAGLSMRAFLTRAGAGTRTASLVIFILNLAAIAANTSRMAQFVGVILLLALVWQLGPAVLQQLLRVDRKAVLAGALAIVLVLFALGQASHLEHPLERWKSLDENISRDARWASAKVALHTLPEAGLLGFGPGTFRVVFPFYNGTLERSARGNWRFLHEDYLQTLLEWGWIGGTLWGVLLFGGMAVAIRNLRVQEMFRRGKRSAQSQSQPPGRVRSPEKDEWSLRRRLILPLAIMAVAGVAVHSLVDFPLQIASIQLYAATYLGICWGSLNWKSGNAEIRSQRSDVRDQTPGVRTREELEIRN